MRVSSLVSALTCAGISIALCFNPVTIALAAGNASAPAASPARLISASEYTNTVVALFGPDFDITTAFSPVRREKGLLAVGSGTAVVTPGGFERFESAARAVSQKVTDAEHRDLLVPCQPRAVDAADSKCARQFVAQVGPLLFRRPLSERETNAFVKVADGTAGRLGDFYAGISDALTGMLVAPDFLFIREQTETSRDGAERLTAYSKATRLSLLLWDAYPDAHLLQAAEDGSLNTKRGLQRQTARMLASPRVEKTVRALFKDMLQFDQFATLAKDPTIYPAFTNKVAIDAEEQALLIVADHLAKNDRDYRDLFTTRETYLTNDLGMLYKVPVSKPLTWVKHTFPDDSPYSGFMTSVGMLSLYSHPGRSSPTKRGRALRELFLCQHVPDPPADVDFSGFEDPKQQFNSARKRLAAHAANPVCAGCHRMTDPMGLALENFDGAGQFRTTEGGEAIDTTGELNGVKFQNAAGLGVALRNDPLVPKCFVERVAAFSLGRSPTPADAAWLAELEAQFKQGGYRYKGLMQAMATSEAFYAVPASAPPAAAKVAALTGAKRSEP